MTSHCEQYIIPGWNDIVSDKHARAREAFMHWVLVGKSSVLRKTLQLY